MDLAHLNVNEGGIKGIIDRSVNGSMGLGCSGKLRKLSVLKTEVKNGLSVR